MTSDAQLSQLVRLSLRGAAPYEVPRPAGIRVKLDANESPFPLPKDVQAELARQLARVELNRYPDPGCGALRSLLAAEHGVAPDAIAFGNGSDELLTLLVQVFGEPRAGQTAARVLYPVPTFSVVGIAASASGVESVEVPLDGDFELDAGALQEAIAASRPNIIYFARPNNPTGSLWSRREIEKIVAGHPDTVCVLDEAYIDYAEDEGFLGRLGELGNLLVMRTLSKVGLASLRVGYAVASPALIGELEKVRPPYNIGSLNQRTAQWVLAHRGDALREQYQMVIEERERVAAAVASLPGVRVFPSRSNLVLLRFGVPGDGRASVIWQSLVGAGVLVRNFDLGPVAPERTPGPLAGCLRVSIGTAEENDRFLAALVDAVQ